MLAWLLILLLMPLSALHAATLNVPSQHATIQGALNAANPGDEVVVAPGTYTGTFTIFDSNLTLRSSTPRGAVLDGQNTSAIGVTTNNALSGVVVDGFEIKRYTQDCLLIGNSGASGWTIQNNYLHHCWERGIELRGSSHLVRNNELYFVGNAVESYGIFSIATGSTIENNLIYFVRKNGIRIATNGNQIVRGNLIAHTQAAIALNLADGGNHISNNYLYRSATGLIVKHSDCTLGDDRFIHNTSHDIHEDGHVWAEDQVAGDCTIWRNNVVGPATDTLVADNTNNRGTNLSSNFNYYHDASFMYNNNAGDDYATLAAFQAATAFEDNSITGAIALADPHASPNPQSSSPILNFTGENITGTAGLGTQVGARSTLTLPYRFNEVPITATAASSDFADADNTHDDTFGTLWQSAGITNESITYSVGGSRYTHIRIRGHSLQAANTFSAFAVDISTNGTDFTQVCSTTVPGSLPGNPAMCELGVQSAGFIRVRFTDVAGGATSIRVDEVWLTDQEAITVPMSKLISASGQIQNPAQDPGDNTDTSLCTDQIFYFDNNAGNDAETCLESELPCKSLTKFRGLSLGPGDCVLFRRGSVWTNETIDMDGRASGTSGNPVVFGSWGPLTSARPKFVWTGGAGVTENFDGQQWKRFDRLYFDGTDTWRFRSGTNNFNMESVRFDNCENACLTWWHGTPTATNTFVFDGVHLDTAGPPTGPSDATGEGFYLGGGSFLGTIENVTIRNCMIEFTGNEALSIKVRTTDVIFEDCLVENNRSADDPGIINTDNADAGANITIRRVVVRNNSRDAGGTHPAVFLGRDTHFSNSIIHNNTDAYCVRGASDSTFFHNTCYQNGAGFLHPSNTMPNANIKGNIGTTIAGNIAESAALFVAATSDDFRLEEGSAAIDLYADCQGLTTDISQNPRPVNTNCDAGAFEFGTVPSPSSFPSINGGNPGFALRTDPHVAHVRLVDPNGGIDVEVATGFSLTLNLSPVTITDASCTSIGSQVALCELSHDGVITSSSDVVSVSYSRVTGNVVDGAGGEVQDATNLVLTNWYDKVFNTDVVLSASETLPLRPVSALFDDEIVAEAGSMALDGTNTMFVEFDVRNQVTLDRSIVAGDGVVGNFYCLTYDLQYKANLGDAYTTILDDINCNQRELVTTMFASPTIGRYWKYTFTGPAAGVQVFEVDTVEVDPVQEPGPEEFARQGGTRSGGTYR